MEIFQYLASSNHRRDQLPNKELAKWIAAKKDKEAVADLMRLLEHKKAVVQGDAVKVLSEIGEIDPSLLKPYTNKIIGFLHHRNNRMIWGAMSVLNSLTLEDPGVIYRNLNTILEAAEKGTVITKDNAARILAKLASVKKYSSDALELLIDILKDCPVNQLGMYAEFAAEVMIPSLTKRFISVIHSRLLTLEHEPKKKRLQKILRKFDN